TAFDYADEKDDEHWQFAVELSELLSTGATLTDVRWLIRLGFAEHAREITVPGETNRSFRALPANCFPPDLCIALTSAGAATIRPQISNVASLPEFRFETAPCFPVGGRGADAPQRGGRSGLGCASGEPPVGDALCNSRPGPRLMKPVWNFR